MFITIQNSPPHPLGSQLSSPVARGVVLCYGAAAYVTSLGTFLYAIGFVSTAVAPDIRRYQFLLGERVIAGNTEARNVLLAIRCAQIRINRELRKASTEC